MREVRRRRIASRVALPALLAALGAGGARGAPPSPPTLTLRPPSGPLVRGLSAEGSVTVENASEDPLALVPFSPREATRGASLFLSALSMRSPRGKPLRPVTLPSPIEAALVPGKERLQVTVPLTGLLESLAPGPYALWGELRGARGILARSATVAVEVEAPRVEEVQPAWEYDRGVPSTLRIFWSGTALGESGLFLAERSPGAPRVLLRGERILKTHRVGRIIPSLISRPRARRFHVVWGEGGTWKGARIDPEGKMEEIDLGSLPAGGSLLPIAATDRSGKLAAFASDPGNRLWIGREDAGGTLRWGTAGSLPGPSPSVSAIADEEGTLYMAAVSTRASTVEYWKLPLSGGAAAQKVAARLEGVPRLVRISLDYLDPQRGFAPMALVVALDRSQPGRLLLNWVDLEDEIVRPLPSILLPDATLVPIEVLTDDRRLPHLLLADRRGGVLYRPPLGGALLPLGREGSGALVLTSQFSPEYGLYWIGAEPGLGLSVRLLSRLQGGATPAARATSPAW